MKYLNRLERNAIEWMLKNNLIGNSVEGNFIYLDENYQNSRDLLEAIAMDSILISILENNSTKIVERGFLIPSQEESIIEFEFELDNLINEFVRLFIKEHQ